MNYLRTCKICGKQFEGRFNSTLCSDECKRENKRIYAQEYRTAYTDKIRERQRQWWNEHKAVNITSADLQESKRKKNKKHNEPKYTGSKWAKLYTKGDRLTRIAMLSWALSQYNIAHLSYGYLSLIWDTEKYNLLLQQVVRLKRQETDKKEE